MFMLLIDVVYSTVALPYYILVIEVDSRFAIINDIVIDGSLEN